MTSAGSPAREAALEEVFAALELDPGLDLAGLALRVGLTEDEVRCCAEGLRALVGEAPRPAPVRAAGPEGWRPMAGEQVGPYELVSLIGAGGMGQVWRARDPAGRDVAVKLALALRASGVAQARLEQEAAVMAAIRDSGVCVVHGAGRAHGAPYVAMELVEGARALDEACVRLDLAARVGLVRDAARALGRAHRRGIVHRDVKPENLLVDAAGRVRVTDFGLALGPELERLTRTGDAPGTPGYMSPEQLRGGEVGPPTDVWALGMILYQLACGSPAFLGPLDVLSRRREPRPPGELEPGVPAALDAICLRCLAADPSSRYPDGEALAAALERHLQDEASPVRRGLGPALAAAALLLCVAAAGLLATRTRGASSAGEARGPAPVAPPSTAGLRGEDQVPSSTAGLRGEDQVPSSTAGLVASPSRAARDRTIRLPHPEPGEVRGLFTPEGDVVTFPVSAPGPVRVWSRRAGHAQTHAWPAPAKLWGGTLLPGPLLVLASKEGTFRARLDGEELSRLDAEPCRSAATLVDAAGEPLLALAWSESSRVRLLRLDPPRELARREGHAGESLRLLVASRDRRLLALLVRQAGDADRVVVLDGATLDEVCTVSPLPGPVRAAFSPDGRRLVVGCRGGSLFLVEALGGPPVQLPPSELAHAGDVGGVAFSADGARLFSAGEVDRALERWSVPAGRLLATRELDGQASGLALSPDGATLLVPLASGGALLLPATED